MSRLAVATELRVDVGTLRAWERIGIMPPFDSLPIDVYRDRIILIIAARERLSMQKVRRALAAGGF